MTSHVSSRVLGTLDPHQVSSVMKDSRAVTGGYPVPGPQTLTVTSAMNKDCFVDENTWRLIAENGEFDDIVVGSGFCALAYVDEGLRLNPFRRILVLERGGFWLPDHFQNLPLPFQFVAQDVSETFPWELTSETAKEGLYLNGSSPFFGGRSSFWSIWSPHAIGKNANLDNGADDSTADQFDLMNGFPRFMKEIAKNPDFYEGADRLLHVKTPEKIEDDVFKWDKLQGQFEHYLVANRANIPGALWSEPARLATGVPLGRPTTGYRQFSAVGSLLSINERQNKLAGQNPPAGKPIMIATDVVVERFELEGLAEHATHARVLHTSRGPLTLRGGKTNVILATGAIPATTILLNSLGETFGNRGGKRLTAHFRSSIKARFAPDDGWFKVNGENGEPVGQGLPTKPVISACHVRGRDNGPDHLQWHIQVHGSFAPEGYQGEGLSDEEKAQLSSRLFTGLAPDNGDTLTPEQAETSEGYVIVSCSVLGEQPTDTKSKVELNKSNPDVTTNIRLHLDLPQNAMDLWDTMENSTFEAIKVIAAGKELQYWNREDGKWENLRNESPSKRHRKRVSSLFHEASATFMGEDLTVDTSASVNKTYRPFSLENGNVYVTGAGLFPTVGSWNPTPTIVGFAQHLAKTLVVPPKRAPVITQDRLVPTTKTLGRPYIIGFKTNGSVSFWSFSGQHPAPPADLPSIFPADFTNIPLADRDILLADLLDIPPADLPNIFSDDIRANLHNIRLANLRANLNNIFPSSLDLMLPAHARANLHKIFAHRNDRHIRLLADTTGRGFYDLVVFNETGVHVAIRSNQRKQNKFNDFRKMTDDFAIDSGWRVDKHIRFMVDARKTGRADIIGFGDTGVFLSKNELDPAVAFAASRAAARAAFTAQNAALAAGAGTVVTALNNTATLKDVDALTAADTAADALVGVPAVTAKAALAAGRAAATATCTESTEDVAAAALALAATGNAEAAPLIRGASAAAAAATAAGDAAAAVPRFKFTAPSIVLHDLGYAQGWRLCKHLRCLAEFYGSGVPDIIGFGEMSVCLVENNGDGTFGDRHDLDLDEFTYMHGWRINKHIRTLADVTGNGLADIVGFHDKGVYIAFNEGHGVVELASKEPVLKNFGYDQNWRVDKHLRMVVDINGDGHGDIVGFGIKGVYVSKNRGKGNFEDARLAIRDFGYEQGWRVEEHPRFMVDLTGDGCADIIGFKDEEAYVTFNDGQGNFGHAQRLTDKSRGDVFSGEGWDSSTSVRYVTRLGHKLNT